MLNLDKKLFINKVCTSLKKSVSKFEPQCVQYKCNKYLHEENEMVYI